MPCTDALGFPFQEEDGPAGNGHQARHAVPRHTGGRGEYRLDLGLVRRRSRRRGRRWLFCSVVAVVVIVGVIVVVIVCTHDQKSIHACLNVKFRCLKRWMLKIDA